MNIIRKNVVYVCFSMFLLLSSVQTLSSINMDSYVKPIHVNIKGLINSPTGPPSSGGEPSIVVSAESDNDYMYLGYYENPDGRLLL